MKKLFIIGNWKSNKTLPDAKEWLNEVLTYQFDPEKLEQKEVIICPPYHLLSTVKSLVDEASSNSLLKLKIGSQNISPFEEGAFTGEVAAGLLKDIVTYSIIGHSERRINFSEDDEMLTKKVELALKNKITPIFCIQDEHTFIPSGVEVVAYEPVFAIGSGKPDTPENANNVAGIVKRERNIPYVIYGGSVISDNVSSFTATQNIDGVLPGKASLDARMFIKLIENS